MSQFERHWTDYLIYLRPKFWTSVKKISYELDEFINKAADEGLIEFSQDEHYKLKVGEIHFWTSNYPYGYGHPYDNFTVINKKSSFEKRFTNQFDEYLPTKVTRYRMKKLEKKLSQHDTSDMDEYFNGLKEQKGIPTIIELDTTNDVQDDTIPFDMIQQNYTAQFPKKKTFRWLG